MEFWLTIAAVLWMPVMLIGSTWWLDRRTRSEAELRGIIVGLIVLGGGVIYLLVVGYVLPHHRILDHYPDLFAASDD